MLSLEKFAVGNYAYQLYTFDYFLGSMERLGIRAIELWAAGPHFYLDDFSDGMIRSLGRQIQEHALSVICLTPEQCAYPINIAACEAYIRERSIRYFERAIQAAAILEVPAVLVTPGQGYRNETRKEAWKRSVDSLVHLADCAKSAGIVLFLEHLTEATTNLAITSLDLSMLVAEIGAPNVKGMLDTDMMGRIGEGIDDFWKAFSGDLAHVHFVDGMPGGHLAPGDGILPMERSLFELRDRGYEGYLTFEITNERYLLMPEEANRKSLAWVKDRLA